MLNSYGDLPDCEARMLVFLQKQ